MIKSNKKSLFVIHAYNNFQKESINSTASYFKENNVLVRTNPISEITKYINIPLLETFKTDYKIDLNKIPSNVHVSSTPILYMPGESAYKKLGEKHFKVVDKYIKKHDIKFDIIHSHYTWSSGYVCAKLKEKYNVPFVITGHGYDVYELPFKDKEWEKNIQYVFNSADRIITVSHSNLAFIKKLNVKTPVTILPNGYSPENFYPMDIEQCRNKLKLPLNKKIMLAVGNLVGVKGHIYLVEAMHEVVKYRKDVLCIIIGGGAMEKKLKARISELKLDNYMELTGSKLHHEIPYWINACDIFVLPSLNEGNPTVMFESLGCQKPFISTRVGGVPEIITSDDYGLLSEPADSKALAENILIALDKNWDKEKIKAYSSQFTWEEIGKNIAKIYDELLN